MSFRKVRNDLISMPDIVFNIKYVHNTNLLNEYMPCRMAILERVKERFPSSHRESQTSCSDCGKNGHEQM